MSARSIRRLLPTIALAFGATACSGGNASTLDTSGPGASRISGLWWAFFAISVFVFVVVVGLLLYGLFRRREPGPDVPDREPVSHKLIIGGGIVFPVVVLVATFMVTLAVMSAEADDDQGSHGMTVEVIGHRWWWEVRYPNADVVTANEVHLPLNQPVLLETTSADVIHSVWIPRLQRKIDAIPGRLNQVTLTATVPGTFRGECAEYCGLQHARMAFVVVAQPQSSFDAWLAQQQQVPPAVPQDPNVERGQEVFFSSACVYCHTIRGTDASGTLGPDLTHLASRRTIGAGTLPNNRGNLAGWIVNPQAIKPGAKMPPNNLSPGDLQALLAYLETLR
jgi:cytochrome c oxidase subunit 2